MKTRTMQYIRVFPATAWVAFTVNQVYVHNWRTNDLIKRFSKPILFQQRKFNEIQEGIGTLFLKFAYVTMEN